MNSTHQPNETPSSVSAAPAAQPIAHMSDMPFSSCNV
jgi:hypothetical protein